MRPPRGAAIEQHLAQAVRQRLCDRPEDRGDRRAPEPRQRLREGIAGRPSQSAQRGSDRDEQDDQRPDVDRFDPGKGEADQRPLHIDLEALDIGGRGAQLFGILLVEQRDGVGGPGAALVAAMRSGRWPQAGERDRRRDERRDQQEQQAGDSAAARFARDSSTGGERLTHQTKSSRSRCARNPASIAQIAA